LVPLLDEKQRRQRRRRRRRRRRRQGWWLQERHFEPFVGGARMERPFRPHHAKQRPTRESKVLLFTMLTFCSFDHLLS
jgi:hypothetical protein